MTILYGLNSCFYDNYDEKIIVKEKEGKRQGKKKACPMRLEPGTIVPK